MQKLLTGLQPSGALHLGNYFGALKPFLDMYGEFESTLLVVDYHALTTLKNPEDLRANIVRVVKEYLALGVNPKRVTIVQQSAVSEHTELAWIFETLVSVPFLMQAHAYKDKVAKGLEANAGLFNYPMLMASDILLYDTDVVPVGADQRQHVEYAREAAAKFNGAYGATFKEPKEYILKSVGAVPGTDGEKMSKSYGNTIPLFGSKDEIVKAVMSIVTDSGSDKPKNVYAIHSLFKSESELEKLYAENVGKYKLLKEVLIEDIDAYFSLARERRESISDDAVTAVLKEGSAKAKERASAKMIDVRKKIGVTI